MAINGYERKATTLQSRRLCDNSAPLSFALTLCWYFLTYMTFMWYTNINYPIGLKSLPPPTSSLCAVVLFSTTVSQIVRQPTNTARPKPSSAASWLHSRLALDLSPMPKVELPAMFGCKAKQKYTIISRVVESHCVGFLRIIIFVTGGDRRRRRNY